MERIGYTVHKLENVRKLAELPSVNLLELKAEYLNLYNYKDGKYTINKNVASEIGNIAKLNDVQVQIHLPIIRSIDKNHDTGLSQTIRDHHGILLDRYKMFFELFNQYNIGKVLTTHAPTTRLNGSDFVNIFDAQKIGNEFYLKLDELVEKECPYIRVGVENNVDPKAGVVVLGYTNDQFRELLKGTHEIGVTLDTGHDLLAKNMDATKLPNIALPYNIHLHTNPGKFEFHTFKDDKHRLADKDNLPKFNQYLKIAKQHRVPIVNEIYNLQNYKHSTINNYVQSLRENLQNI